MENEAYYTDGFLAETMGLYFPDFEKPNIRILEPSVGTGNLLGEIIKKYADKNVILDVFDIDGVALSKLKKNLEILPKNFKINFHHEDFLAKKIHAHYDLVVGNPPFKFSREFLEKCLTLSEKIVMIMPKSFLMSAKFSRTREFIENIEIENILDFGERGFSDVKIETICLFLNTSGTPSAHQKYITDKTFPYWLIYRDENFDKVSKKLEFGVFSAARDRDLKNEILSSEKSAEQNIWVIRSRNITPSGLKHFPGYDRFVSKADMKGSKALKYLGRDALIAPNMTGKIRVARKTKNSVCNGSVALLIPKPGVEISVSDLAYFSSAEFHEFYDVATNRATRTKNIDKNTVYFFGLLKKHKKYGIM